MKKRYIASASNTSSIGIKPVLDPIEAAADDEVAETLDDKIKDVENDFDFLIAGIEQLDTIQANEFINQIHDTLRELISDVTSEISE